MNYAFIQARINSNRLPGKVLLPLCNKTVLDHVYERVNKAKLVDKVYVLTGIDPVNNPIVEHCIKHGYNYYLGEPDNVLKRFYDLASIVSKEPNDNIIRITCDCPLIDPGIIDKMLAKWNGRYITNQQTFIDGFDVEIMSHGTLDYIYMWHKYDEHVTLNFKNAWGRDIEYYNTIPDLHRVHLSLDTQKDYETIKKIYEALYWKDPNFGYDDVVEHLELK